MPPAWVRDGAPPGMNGRPSGRRMGPSSPWLREDGERTVIQTAAVDGSSQGRPIAVAADATALVAAPDGSGWLVVRPDGFDLLVERADGRDGPLISVAAPGTSGIVSWEATRAG